MARGSSFRIRSLRAKRSNLVLENPEIASSSPVGAPRNDACVFGIFLKPCSAVNRHLHRERVMSRKIHILFLIPFFLIPGILQAEVIDRIVALVNSDAITLSELEEAAGPAFEQLRQTTLPSERERKMSEARKGILDLLIEGKVLEQEIKNKKIEVPDRDVDNAIEDILKQNRMTENELKLVMAKEGMSYSLYRQRIRDDIGKMRLISREIKSKLMVKEEDIRKFYEDHRENFVEPAEVQVQQIFFHISPGASDEQAARVRGEAYAILDRIRKGEDFTKLVKDYSQGPEVKYDGILGHFKRNELRPELDRAAFSLNTGGVSDVIRTTEGFHILRVLEKKGGEPRSYAEMQAKIRDQLAHVESEKQFREWMKSLKSKAYIEVKL
jgi:peptidyl-prolyl cis-trans isomerase SurA